MMSKEMAYKDQVVHFSQKGNDIEMAKKKAVMAKKAPPFSSIWEINGCLDLIYVLTHSRMNVNTIAKERK